MKHAILTGDSVLAKDVFRTNLPEAGLVFFFMNRDKLCEFDMTAQFWESEGLGDEVCVDIIYMKKGEPPFHDFRNKLKAHVYGDVMGSKVRKNIACFLDYPFSYYRPLNYPEWKIYRISHSDEAKLNNFLWDNVSINFFGCTDNGEHVLLNHFKEVHRPFFNTELNPQFGSRLVHKEQTATEIILNN